MVENIRQAFKALPEIVLEYGLPSISNLIATRVSETYTEGAKTYPMNRGPVIIELPDGQQHILGNRQRPLIVSYHNALATVQRHVARDLPDQEPVFMPTLGILNAHDHFLRSLKWAIDQVNLYGRSADMPFLKGGTAIGQTTFFLFEEQCALNGLTHLPIPTRQAQNWAIQAADIGDTLNAALHKLILPLGFTSISPDAPIHNIRDAATTRAFAGQIERHNEQRKTMLVAFCGGPERYQRLRDTNPDFKQASDILERLKIFEDCVYLPLENSDRPTCLFAELHREFPKLVDDIVTGISLSKVGTARFRPGAAFIFNDALAQRMSRYLSCSIDGPLYETLMVLALLRDDHPLNEAFAKSIDAYRTRLADNNQLLEQLFSQYPVAGVYLAPDDTSGYFKTLVFDPVIWTPVLDAHFPDRKKVADRKAQDLNDQAALFNLLKDVMKITLHAPPMPTSDGGYALSLRLCYDTAPANIGYVFDRLAVLANMHRIWPQSIGPQRPAKGAPALTAPRVGAGSA